MSEYMSVPDSLKQIRAMRRNIYNGEPVISGEIVGPDEMDDRLEESARKARITPSGIEE